jgi:hypothetical protein
LLGSAVSLRAGTFYVPNYSFESPPTQTEEPQITSWQETPQPADLDTNYFTWNQMLGVFANLPSAYPGSITNCDGNQLAFMFAYPQLGIFQDYNSIDGFSSSPIYAFNAKFQQGKSYRLTVGLTSSSYEPLNQGSTLQLSLYYRDASSNMVTVANTTVTYDTNVFTNLDALIDFNVTITNVQASDAWAGKNIGIEIVSTVAPENLGGVWDMDNVRLTEAVYVPNFSFESPATQTEEPQITSWQETPQPADLDTNYFQWNQMLGVFANLPPGYPGSIVNCDGNQLAFMFAYPQLGIFQDYNSIDGFSSSPSHAFNAKYETGKSYQLTVGLTSSSYEPLNQGSTLQLSLYYRDVGSNMVTVAQTTVTYDTNVFTNLDDLIDFQVTVPGVKATNPWAGKNIGIEIVSTVAPQNLGGVWDIDNVRLVDTVAPALVQPTIANGQFSFTLQSEPNVAFNILATTNLAGTNWVNIATVTNTTGSLQFTDPSTNFVQRFYQSRGL